ncbi:MAG: hypothetical protein PHG06_06355 [Parabacteroides sp.]|nr:hypothetical protein [Parabacteroides sp.]
MQETSTKFNKTVLLIAIAVIGISFVGIVLVNQYWKNTSLWKDQVILLLGAIETSAIVVSIWEFIAKKSFAKEMLSLAKISSNVEKSGIIHIYNDFQDIQWKAILDHTKSFQVAATYANTWREGNRKALKDFVEDKKNLTVYLPDFTDESILGELASRLNMPNEKIREKIRESCNSFKNEIGATVYLYHGCFQSSYYLSDNAGIMSFFNHKKEKSIVPALEISNQGELYGYISSEFESIKKNSSEWTGGSDEK